MSEQLKPCPFCGNAPLFWTQSDGNSQRIACYADDCPANPEIIGTTVDGAITAWNRRTPDKAT